MHDQEFETFRTVLLRLAQYFPHSRPKVSAVVDGYFYHLQALTLAEVEQVCLQAMRTCKYFPTVAELRQLGGVAAREAEQQRQQAHRRSLPLERNPAGDAVTLRLMRELLDKTLPGWQIPDPDDPVQLH
jgi:hypothetical protein